MCKTNLTLVKENTKDSDFGYNSIKDIIKQFSSKTDSDDVINEYALFKHIVKNEGTPDFPKFRKKNLREYNHTFQ